MAGPNHLRERLARLGGSERRLLRHLALSEIGKGRRDGFAEVWNAVFDEIIDIDAEHDQAIEEMERSLEGRDPSA